MQITPEILIACSRQDRRAQKLVYEFCYMNFIKLCMRYHSNHEDARFVFNNGFLKILKGLETVELTDLQFVAWAKRIMTNAIIDDYRKNKNHNTVIRGKETEEELAYHAGTGGNEAESNLGEQSIMKLLGLIPAVSAHVFTLYVIDGFSHKEIGDLLDITEGTSKWHLSTARKLLREKLELLETPSLKKVAI